MDAKARAKSVAALNPGLYQLEGTNLAFYQRATGIEDEEELRKHILAVQERAFGIFKYTCIRIFDFLRLRMLFNPAYEQALALQRRRTDAIFLEFGACFGQESRKAIQDGWPAEQIVSTDIQEGLWNEGHALFKSNPTGLGIRFIGGDVRHKEFLDPDMTAFEPASPVPLSDITTLNDLRGRVSVILADLFFHQFKKVEQQNLARAMAGLLSPEPGSMIFGNTSGLPQDGLFIPTGTDMRMECYSPTSFAQMWYDAFGDGHVEVKATLEKSEDGFEFDGTFPGNKQELFQIQWSVSRL